MILRVKILDNFMINLIIIVYFCFLTLFTNNYDILGL